METIATLLTMMVLVVCVVTQAIIASSLICYLPKSGKVRALRKPGAKRKPHMNCVGENDYRREKELIDKTGPEI